MFRKFSSPPRWEALPEPEPSSDDELHSEPDTHQNPDSSQARFSTQNAKDSTEAIRHPPPSTPPSTSTNAVVGHSSPSQMKRKESEPMFTSKKRARYAQAARGDQDDPMDLDMDEHAKNKGNLRMNTKSSSVQGTMGGLAGRPLGASLFSSNRKHSDPIFPSTSTNKEPSLLAKRFPMKFPPSPKRSSQSAVAEGNQPPTRDLPSKLAGLPFHTYKRADGKTVVASDSGRSKVPSPIYKFVGKGKVPLKHRVASAPQNTRSLSTSNTNVIPPAEIIEVSDDDSPPMISVEQSQRRSRAARKTISSFMSAPKKYLPKAPIEVIEIFDSDDEPTPSKVQLPQQESVGASSGNRLLDLVQECATGSIARRGQPRHMSPLGGDSVEGSDGDADGMVQPASAVSAVGSPTTASDSEIYPASLFWIPSSPRASSQEPQANDDQATADLIPLPSSSPSSMVLSPQNNHLSTPLPTTSTALLARSSFSQQPSVSVTSPNSVDKKSSISAGASTGTGSHSNRLRFSCVTVPSSLQAPPPANKHSRQFARKSSTSVPQPTSDQELDGESGSEAFEKEATAKIKANKGKEKETCQSSSSSSGTESINMRGLRDALTMTSDKLAKQRLVLPKKGGQTLAEAITSAGQLNRTKKKMGRRLQGHRKDLLTSNVEEGSGSMIDESEKGLKAAIGSSKLLVNLLPSLKERGSASPDVIAATSAKVTEAPASSPRLALSPLRTQSSIGPPQSSSIEIEKSFYPSSLSSKRNIKAHELPSPMRPSSPRTEMQVKEQSVGDATDATPQPQAELSTVFGFKSGTAVIGPSKIPLPKRPSAATFERVLAAGRESSDALPQTHTGTIGSSGKADDVPMADVSSRSSMLANMFSTSLSTVPMTPSLTPLPLPPCHLSPMRTQPFKGLTPPKRSSLAMTETSIVASSTSSQPTPPTSTIDHRSGGTSHDDASITVVSARKLNSPKLANVQPALLRGSNDVRIQLPGKQPSLARAVAQPLVSAASKSHESTMTPISAETAITARNSDPPKLANVQPASLSGSISSETISSRPQSTAANDILPSFSMCPPAVSLSTIVPASSSAAVAAPERSFDTIDLLPDDARDAEEEECQALLQSNDDDMDVVPSHDVQPSLRDGMVDHISLNTSVSSSSASTYISPTRKVFNDSISPLLQEVPVRRSSRRSSRSSNSDGLGTAFDEDFGTFDSVPDTRTPTPEDQEHSASPPGSPKTYGGFRALTWKNFRADLNNFIPKVYYSKDLPHALQDHINSMSEYTQRMEGMRNLFKAIILENTVEDEPDAPPIEVWNDVDTQSTPPWEFYYTNQMWLGEGVPPPDIKSLVSCTCKGGCNPKSKTCACLLRQKAAAGNEEFAYDKSGKLKIPGYPIFECNDLCGCSEECRNRVVQHGRKVAVSIGKTEAKGWGVFAGPKKIPGGTYIGIYSGELLTDAEAHERGIKYNKFGRTYLFDIDFHHLKEGNRRWENSFTVDAYHAGNFTRFLNHSCDPNCRLYACYINEGNIQKPLLAIFSRRDIEPYEEICFNYQGSYPNDDDDEDSDDEIDHIAADPEHGKDSIYVQCRCGARNCTGTMFK